MTRKSIAVENILTELAKRLDFSYDAAVVMPPSFYSDPDFFEIEKERIFYKEWVCLGRVEEVSRSGDYMVAELVGEPLLITRTEDDEIRVLSNVCRHRGAQIADGTGNTKRFVCPYHSWSYNLKGELLNAPYIGEQSGFVNKGCKLPEFACEVWQGFIFVNLSGDAPPLAPRLAGLVPLVNNYHLETMQCRYVSIDTWPVNWKCLAENFIEGYHLSTVHTRTIHPLTPTRLCEHFDAGEGYFGYIANFPADLPARGQHHPTLTDKQRNSSCMFVVPPGLLIGVSPHMTAYACIQPIGAGEVRIKLSVAVYDHEMQDEELRDIVNLFEHTMAEDKVRLVALQKALSSRFIEPGPLAPQNYEGTILDMYHYIARRVLNQPC